MCLYFLQLKLAISTTCINKSVERKAIENCRQDASASTIINDERQRSEILSS